MHYQESNEFDYVSSTNYDQIEKDYNSEDDQFQQEDDDQYENDEYYDDDDDDDQYDDNEQNQGIQTNKQKYNTKIVKGNRQIYNDYDNDLNEEDISQGDEQLEDQYSYENQEEYDSKDDQYEDDEEYYDEQEQIEQEEYSEQIDEEYQQQQKPQSKPRISDAGFRILNFEIRKNDPTIPRNAAKRTIRDEEGKRVTFHDHAIIPINLEKEVVNQANNNLDENVFEKNQKNMKSSKIQQAIERLRKANQQRKWQKYQFEDYRFEEWHGFSFTDQMHSPQDLQFVQDKIVNYNSIFEVDDQFNFDKTLLIKPYIRSNQGRVDLNFRSQKAFIKSMTRLIEIIVNRNQIHKDGTNVSYLDIFEYVHDRFRAIVTELTQIDSKNVVSQFRIILLEKIIRFYLYSYYEMLILKDNKQALDNIIAIKKYLGKYVTCLCEDYLAMLTIAESDKQLFNNLPEFIQYQFLINLLEHQSFDSAQRMSQLGNDLMNHKECYKKLIETQEYQFTFQIQEYIITKNFNKIEEILTQQLTFFQRLFIYLIVEMFHKIKTQFLKKCFVFVSDNFFPDLDDLLSDLIQLNPQQISLELITKSSEIINQNQVFEKCKITPKYESQQLQPQLKKQQSIIVNIFHKFSQYLLFKQTLKELKPLISFAETYENQKVQFYIKKLRFNHWKKIYRTIKQQKYYDSILSQPKCILSEKPYRRKNTKYNFFNCIAMKLAQNYPNLEHYYYKIVFIYSDLKYLSQFYYNLCRIQIEESHSMNIDFKYLNRNKFLQIHIQCINQIQDYKLLGSDLIFNLQDLNENSPNKTIIIMQKYQQYHLKWNEIEMFDNLLENISFNNSINKVIEESLLNKVFYPKLKTVSLIEIMFNLKDQRYLPQNNHYKSDSIETFISYCYFWDFYLNTLLAQHINDTLPQEIFFDQYLINQNIKGYVEQYNLLTLGIQFISQLNSEFTTFNMLIRIISKFLNGSIDQQVYEEIFYQNFEMINNRKSIKGNWSMLYEQIINDIINYIYESDQYFIILDSSNITLQLNQLDQKIEAFLATSLSQPKIIELDEDEKLMQWIRKKIQK